MLAFTVHTQYFQYLHNIQFNTIESIVQQTINITYEGSKKIVIEIVFAYLSTILSRAEIDIHTFCLSKLIY
jgi:hypothetical protein